MESTLDSVKLKIYGFGRADFRSFPEEICPTTIRKTSEVLIYTVVKRIHIKRNIVSISILTLFLITACNLFSGLGFRTIRGSSRIITEVREESDFNRVDVCCGMQLYLTQAGTESLQIEANDNLLAEIETRVVGGKLDIYNRNMNGVSYRPTQPVHVLLSMKEILSVSVSGAGILETRSTSGNRFELDLSGSSSLGYYSQPEIVDQDTSGGSNIESLGSR